MIQLYSPGGATTVENNGMQSYRADLTALLSLYLLIFERIELTKTANIVLLPSYTMTCGKKILLSVQCNALHGTEYKITCGVCVGVCVRVRVRTGVWGRISRKREEIETWYQWSTNRKRLMGNRLVTCPMTSRDLERSRSWPSYL